MRHEDIIRVRGELQDTLAGTPVLGARGVELVINDADKETAARSPRRVWPAWWRTQELNLARRPECVSPWTAKINGCEWTVTADQGPCNRDQRGSCCYTACYC